MTSGCYIKCLNVTFVGLDLLHGQHKNALQCNLKYVIRSKPTKTHPGLKSIRGLVAQGKMAD